MILKDHFFSLQDKSTKNTVHISITLRVEYWHWPHTTERGLVEEVLVLEQEEVGLDVFWEPRSRVVGGGEETVLFRVWISLWGGEKGTGDDTFTKHQSDVAFSHLKVLLEHFSKMAQQFGIVVK